MRIFALRAKSHDVETFFEMAFNGFQPFLEVFFFLCFHRFLHVFDGVHRNRASTRSHELYPGATVRLVGLERSPQLEGKTGRCLQLETDGYVRVRLDSGELKAAASELWSLDLHGFSRFLMAF